MQIHPAQLIEEDGCVRVQASIELSDRTETLWYAVEPKFAHYLTTERLDAFLVGLLLLAMRRGEDVVVHGAISERLYYDLTQYYTSLARHVIPSLRPVRIEAEALDDGSALTCEGGVATGFSCGIDAFSTVNDHYLSDVVPGFRLTHLLFANVGSHGEWDADKARALFRTRLALVGGCAAELGLPLVSIDSNLSDVLQWSFQQTHVPRNVSAVLTLQKLVSKYYYASGYRYEDVFVGESHDIACCDPVALPLLGTETLDCIPAGGQFSRIEKTQRIAPMDLARRWLNVCVAPDGHGGNCSRCFKCCRTLMTLEVLGALDDFAGVFDLQTWAEVRDWYIVNVVLRQTSEPLAREIREYARDQHFAFKPWQRAAGTLLRFPPAFAVAKYLRGRVGTRSRA